MKLVLATPLYPPEIGGPATYAKALFEGLPARGIEVALVRFSDVRRLPKLLRHYAFYRRVFKAARDADMVLALDPVSVGLPAMRAARKLGKRFVVKVVGDYAWEQGRQRFGVSVDLDEFVKETRVALPVWLLRAIQRRVARKAQRVIVPSAYLKRIVETWGVPEERLAVIYNASPLDALGTLPEAVAVLSRPRVVSVGRLVPWKHMDDVIDAVSGASGASLALVGEGPERARLAAHAEEKLAGRFAMTGMLSRSDALAVIASSDVFVLNSSYEGLSHALIEALEQGVPIIATSAGGNAEVVTDGETGLLVPPGDTLALAGALERLMNDAGLRARLAANAKASAARFSEQGMLDATASFLKSL